MTKTVMDIRYFKYRQIFEYFLDFSSYYEHYVLYFVLSLLMGFVFFRYARLQL